MLPLGFTSGVACLVLVASMPGCAASGDAAHRPVAATLTPVPSQEDRAGPAGWGTGNWLDQHADINRIGEDRRVELVFLGDSITQSWGGPGRRVGAPAAAIWDEYFADLNAASFGISGDRTQHVLWRIDHGNLDSIEPRVTVLMIGTNSLRDDAPEDIAAGIEAIIDRLEEKAPGATVLLMNIVRGQFPEDPLRRKADRTNRLIEPLDARPNVRFVDLTSRFYRADGQADPVLMRADFVHFSTAGYRAWAEILQPNLRMLIDEARDGDS